MGIDLTSQSSYTPPNYGHVLVLRLLSESREVPHVQSQHVPKIAPLLDAVPNHLPIRFPVAVYRGMSVVNGFIPRLKKHGRWLRQLFLEDRESIVWSTCAVKH